MQHATQCLGVVKNVLNVIICFCMDGNVEYFKFPLFSYIANYKTEEVRIAKYNRRGDVVMHCHRNWALEAEMQILSVEKGTLGVLALNYVTSLVILRLAQVGRRSCRQYLRNTPRNGLGRWCTAILSLVPLHPVEIFIVLNVRFLAHDFYLADVRLCGRQLYNPRYILQIQQARWVFDVIFMRCHYYWTRGWHYFVRHMLLRFVEVV